MKSDKGRAAREGRRGPSKEPVRTVDELFRKFASLPPDQMAELRQRILMEPVSTRFLTVDEAAEKFKVSAITIRRWIKDGLLEHERFGKKLIRIPESAFPRPPKE